MREHFIRALDQYVCKGGAVALDLDELSRIVTLVIDRPELSKPVRIACIRQKRSVGG